MKTAAESALSRFRVLEERIAGALDALRNARQEKEAADRELSETKGRIRQLEQEVAELREERSRIRDRVEHLIASISELDGQKEDSVV